MNVRTKEMPHKVLVCQRAKQMQNTIHSKEDNNNLVWKTCPCHQISFSEGNEAKIFVKQCRDQS